MSRLTKKEKRTIWTAIITLGLIFVLMVLFVPEITYTAAVEPDVAGSLEKFVVWFTKAQDWFKTNYVLILLSVLGVFGLKKIRK